MRIIVWVFMTVWSIGLTTIGRAADQPDCIAASQNKGQTEIKGVRPGAELLGVTYFLAAGMAVDLVLREDLRSSEAYYGRIESQFDSDGNGKSFLTINRSSISAKKITEKHAFVTRGLADKTDTLITIQVPVAIGGFWNSAKLYVYSCAAPPPGKDATSPTSVSAIMMPVSSGIWSGSMAFAAVLVLYVFAAITTKAVSTKQAHWSQYLNPVFLTAGSDGKGSLSKLQILFFSMIVFGLLAYILLRTGVLSDLSSTVLMLLGIAAVGSSAAKATDVQRTRIDFDNWAWFIRRGWLPSGGLAAFNNAKWRDIVTVDGEFDVYRYQSCIFSLVVGGALLVAGVTELASFTIPEALLGILGLSQVVFVAGKLVGPPSWSDLNKSTTALRDLERKLCDASAANPDPSPPPGTSPLAPPANRAAAIQRGVLNQYDAYMNAAESLRIAFESVTGRGVTNIQASC